MNYPPYGGFGLEPFIVVYTLHKTPIRNLLREENRVENKIDDQFDDLELEEIITNIKSMLDEFFEDKERPQSVIPAAE